MTASFIRHRRRPATAFRVGLFGAFGSGNIGNDASLEVMLRYLRADHLDAIVDVMCDGPEVVRARYGLAAIAMNWSHQRDSGAAAIMVKVLGRCIDGFRMAFWVRRHDVVIVPGMGILEVSLPLRPWQFPCTMFLLCASGRLLGTKVALVSVGADIIRPRLTRGLFIWASRLAFYRSYRDALSHDAMRRQGLDTTRDHVFADIAFALPAPVDDAGDPLTVGVGVMEYHGGNDDRARAAELHASYTDAMKSFARWLVDSGHRIRLFVGDTNGSDDRVVQEIMTDLRESRPGLDPGWVVTEPVSTFAELMRAMASVGTLVATRYHNLICAFILAKPAISIEYSAKNTALMGDMGLPQYCHSIRALDVGFLIKQFTELETRATELRQTIMEHSAANRELLDRQFAELSAALFPAAEPTHGMTEQELTRRG